MSVIRWLGLACAGAAALAFAFPQGTEAPPAIEQGGISNWASHIATQLPSGALAPRSLVRIRGWRLGPAPLASISVRIRVGDTTVRAETLSAEENQIEALLPANTPTGAANIQVIKNGQASLEWPVTIAESSFGAFSRNGQGWGPGEFSNSDGSPNSEEHPARPGETVQLAGTGLGVKLRPAPPHVLVAGHPAAKVRLFRPAATRPGVDGIEFTLPPDTPLGCHVPVLVSSAPDVYSNAVTLSVSKNGACDQSGGWSAAAVNHPVRLANLALLHADLLLDVTEKQTAHYPVDAGFASFATIEPGDVANPLFLFPPLGSCTTYSGTAGLHSITNPISALAALPGKPLDGGAAVSVEGLSGNRSLPRDHSPRANYWAVLGGQSPAPGAKELPLFLTPGDYRLKTSDAASAAALDLRLRMRPPLIWTNRDQIAQVDRARDFTVTWQSNNSRIPTVVLIVAMNVDARSGALGLCACLANGADGAFRVPAYALANIPQSPERPRGFPLNLVLLTELPTNPNVPAAGSTLDRIVAFAASVSGRTVLYK